VEAIPGIQDCHAVRVRTAGPGLFADLHVYLDPGMSLEDAHTLTQQAAQVIRSLEPRADVTVHAEPTPKSSTSSDPREQGA